MNSFVVSVCVGFMSAIALASGASAATVSLVVGEALINQGNGFQPLSGAAASADLKPGSQVMVRPGGSALITYASNCAVKVPSGIWAVQSAPPCEPGTSLVDFTTRMNQEAPPPNDEATALIVGGIIVAGAVGACALLCWNDGPSSP